jgi:hypothetical protein
MYNSLRVMLLLASVLASVGQPVGCEAAVLGMRVTAHLPPTWPVARWMVEGPLLGLYSENTRGLTATGSPNCEPRRVKRPGSNRWPEIRAWETQRPSSRRNLSASGYRRRREPSPHDVVYLAERSASSGVARAKNLA